MFRSDIPQIIAMPVIPPPSAPLFDVREISTLSRPDAENRIRSLCHTVYLGDNEILARCLGRYKIFLDSRDAGVCPHFMLDGFWEFWITQFMVREVKPGMTVLDVGANFGYFSLLLADLIGNDGRQIAVEPNPQVAAKLRKTLALNGFDGRTRVEEVALSRNPDGEVSFAVSQMNPGGSRIVPRGTRREGSETITVRSTNIDTMCAKLDRVDFIKIDAEGAEGDILEGMKETIARHRPMLLMEMNSTRPYDIGAIFEGLARNYSSIGYVDFDSQIKPVTAHDLQTKNVGTEWMILCRA